MRIVITRREAADVPDGINSFIFSLATALIELGHEVHLISGARCSVEQVKGHFRHQYYPEVHSVTDQAHPNHFTALVGWLKTRVFLVRRLRPDFAIINGALPFSLCAASCTLSHDLEARWNYGNAIRRAYKLMSYRMSSYIAATCSELQAALARELVVNINRIDVIPTCLNLRNYFTIKPRDRVRAILHVGTAAYKNAAATIEAFSRIDADDVRLFIVGVRDAALERSLTRLSLGLQSRVVCCGRVSAEEFIALASSVRIVSVPSLYRVAVASPTVLEAFACGTPVVGSESISRDILDNGVNGYRCNAGDVEAIAGCFERLLSDEDCWRSLSANAAATARRFSNVNIGNRYLALACGRGGAV